MDCAGHYLPADRLPVPVLVVVLGRQRIALVCCDFVTAVHTPEDAGIHHNGSGRMKQIKRGVIRPSEVGGVLIQSHNDILMDMLAGVDVLAKSDEESDC